MRITIELNGQKREIDCEVHETLLTVLRREGMSSVRFGSSSGETGASAVLFDGRLASSEVILAAQADGHSVITLESLNTEASLHPVQAAFAATGAMQSGYSVGAMILGALQLLEENPTPTETEIRDMLSGILDRETAYVKPVAAIKQAAALLRGEEPEPFRPLILKPMTDGVNAVEVDPNDSPPDASDAVPRLVPSSEVPSTSVVGQPEIKVDAVRLVKGNPAFTADFDIRGLLHAKVLLSPHAHARIISIDDSEANALPGVHAVIHHENINRVKYASGGQSYPNPKPHDQVSFDNKVRHVSDRVAAVAAETPEKAKEG